MNPSGITIYYLWILRVWIFLVAVQDEQSEGLGGIFGGGSNTAFGSHASSVVTKATATLAVVFMVLALVVAFVNKSPSQDKLLDSVKTEQVQQTTDWWVESETPASTVEAPAATN